MKQQGIIFVKICLIIFSFYFYNFINLSINNFKSADYTHHTISLINNYECGINRKLVRNCHL